MRFDAVDCIDAANTTRKIFMTTETQREMLFALAEVWSRSPEVRLGQLFAHLGFLGEVHLDRGLGIIDDDELMSILNRHRAELEARVQTPLRNSHPATV